ncbi:MAG: hypothetical protein IJT30_10680 [Muribaculaceae bacterium]|nr:hypothetical protein [Muribaculaceae bacterium]
MNRNLLTLLCLLAALGSCRAQCGVIDVTDILDLFNFRPTIAVGANEERDAAELTSRAVAAFTTHGFTHGLTGDGYGGPCVIIDGFHKGGTVNREQCSFEPGADADQACVVEMSACNNGDVSDYELLMSVQVFSNRSAALVLHQFSQHGFSLTEMPADDDHCQLSNGMIVVDFDHDVDIDAEGWQFVIQTRERRNAYTMPATPDEKYYQENE